MNVKQSRAELVDLLTRREIEALIAGPLLEGFREHLPEDVVRDVMSGVIRKLAEEQGAALAQQWGGDSLTHFAKVMDIWTEGGALELHMIDQARDKLYFNVTRCNYAELYRKLGIAHLGPILSCCRDGALAKGFNPRIELHRTQTIMEGADYCDFRYTLHNKTD
jgi:predicted hydrocarbon binding protein